MKMQITDYKDTSFFLEMFSTQSTIYKRIARAGRLGAIITAMLIAIQIIYHITN